MNVYYAIVALIALALLVAIGLLKIILSEYLEIDIDFSKPKPQSQSIKVEKLTPKDNAPITSKFETIDI